MSLSYSFLDLTSFTDERDKVKEVPWHVTNFYSRLYPYQSDNFLRVCFPRSLKYVGPQLPSRSSLPILTFSWLITESHPFSQKFRRKREGGVPPELSPGLLLNRVPESTSLDLYFHGLDPYVYKVLVLVDPQDLGTDVEGCLWRHVTDTWFRPHRFRRKRGTPDGPFNKH